MGRRVSCCVEPGIAYTNGLISYLNGFNSSPDEPLYAAANYLPSTIPLIWSQK